MWVRAAVIVPLPIGVLTEGVSQLSTERLATLVQAASHDASHLRVHLGSSVLGEHVTTFHLRWWNDRNRSLTPALDGELELRRLNGDRTRIAITAQYRCHELLRELGDTIFLRRVAESLLAAFLDSLQNELQASAPALTGHRS
jgi:hypothetical protein